MAERTYRLRGVVLKKTKLGERDLIVSMLCSDGSLKQGVAKGARKPGGSLAAKLELFSVVDAMLAHGRSLDVVADARFVPGFEPHAFGVEQAACASAIAELVCTVAQEGLAHERLFDMTVRALASISAAEPVVAVALCVADLLKTLAMAGFRPSFDTCVACGEAIAWPSAQEQVLVSIADGGVVCNLCPSLPDAQRFDARTIAWARALLASTFAQIAARSPDASISFELLQFTRQWTRVHVGKNLKSVDYLLTSGLCLP